MTADYDVIVIGAGHAGCEAAAASARLGARTLLITSDMNRIAQMSCNPAVGGIAKGQIVREIDALGGRMAQVTDAAAIQFRMLNSSKGPAVWSPRSQCDRTLFSMLWRHILENTPSLSMVQDTVSELLIAPSAEGKKPHVIGVKTELGVEFRAKCAVLTAGTFLNGLLHFGSVQKPGGRISESAATGLTEQLRALGFATDRMKTGTPVRIDGRSIDFSKTQRQDGDADENHRFSFLPASLRRLPARPCWICHTNSATHEILRASLSRSPLYNGRIQSIGPRYCPSIETKIVTFADKESHQLFLEPEGADTQEYYLNGFSSSLPYDVQLRALATIPALAQAHIYRPGYAIEYDFFDPTQLYHSLETKLIDGLFMAGQVNGTTGYEEAAGQGLMAGINAARKTQGKPAVVLRRDQAYIGVLIDDLVTKGVDEPYRMFTSRAEYRILLRQDDADMRLTPLGHEIGLASDQRYALMLLKRKFRDEIIDFAQKYKVRQTDVEEYFREKGLQPLSGGIRLYDLLLRPGVAVSDLVALLPPFARLLKRQRKEFLAACSSDEKGVSCDKSESSSDEKGVSDILSPRGNDASPADEKGVSSDKSESSADEKGVSCDNILSPADEKAHFTIRDEFAGISFLPPLRDDALAKSASFFIDEALESAEILIKYSGYIERESLLAAKIKRLEETPLLPDFPYESVGALSTEARQKLSKIRPATLAQASRIPGVSPADINILLLLLHR